jgi:hypothetical protein
VACPGGCKKDQCLSLPGGGFWCNECVTGLVLNSVDGTCGCPPGRFSAAAPDQAVQCIDCPKGDFCRGGSFEAAVKTPCGEGLTTIGQRASAPSNCGESTAGLRNPAVAARGFFVSSMQAALQTVGVPDFANVVKVCGFQQQLVAHGIKHKPQSGTCGVL